MKPYKTLRILRTVVQVAVTVALAVCIGLGVPCVLSHMQIVPAILSCAGVWIAMWLLATMLFGRIYCSLFCPCGALMDLFIALRPKKKRFVYSHSKNLTRLTMLVLVIVGALAGVGVLLSLFDPYSTFARMVTAAVKPAFVGIGALSLAGITLCLIGIIAYKRGRLICNTVCPVGSTLGAVSRFSLFHADINTDLCVNCRRCVDVCRAECIDIKDHVVDSTRCVDCFACMDECSTGAITFRRGRHQLSIPMMKRTEIGTAGVSAATPTVKMHNASRRTFILSALAGAGSLASFAAPARNKFYVEGSKKLQALNPVTPPGTFSRDSFLRKCVGCESCVASCPTGVLVPSEKQYGVRHALVPVMDFNTEVCSFNCKKCTDVCPTGALSPLTLAEKRTVAIGKARIQASNCAMYVNGVRCGCCARACPKRAISIVSDKNGRMFPRLEPELCIGCGSCSVACPAKPNRAIVIEGL